MPITYGFISGDWTIDANKDIRYTGDGHTGTSPSYATVIDFHRALQALADDAQADSATGDLIDISTLSPSERATDNFITLINGFNINKQAAEHLYGGSISQLNGDDLYDGVVNFGNSSYINIVQDGAIYPNPFWNANGTGTFNPDSNQGISHQFLIQTRLGGADIDGRRLLGLSRQYGKTYSEFQINGTARGNNVLALSEIDDLNNQTAEATVGTYTIATEDGYVEFDVNNDLNNEPFYVRYTNQQGLDINAIYEYTKYLTRTGGSDTVSGLSGELFRGVTHDITVTVGEAGTSFIESDAVQWTTGGGGGAGQLLATDNVTNPTSFYIQLYQGIAPSVGDLILPTNGTGFATVTAIVERNVPQHIAGASTGTSLIGAYGVGVAYADLTVGDVLTGLDNTPYNPPNLVTFTVNGLVAGEDRVLVANSVNGVIDKTQFTLNEAIDNATVSTIVISSAIPLDTPATGTLRIENISGVEVAYPYSSYDGSTFNLTSATDISGNNAIAITANAYLSYIDTLASGTEESFTSVFDSNRSLFIRVRDGGASPIKTFETTGTLGSAGGSTTAIRTADA